MNGRLTKVYMTAKVMTLKNSIDSKVWYPNWDSKERWAAQQALNNVLDILDEYSY
jgi:hemerythrin superfamily protein|tara:strand:- start:174 stop:338 length:165 start_codon:yes stop_codon:yes gene_type:complete